MDVSWGPLPKGVSLAKTVTVLQTDVRRLMQSAGALSVVLGVYASLPDSRLEVKFHKTGGLHDHVRLIPAQTSIC